MGPLRVVGVDGHSAYLAGPTVLLDASPRSVAAGQSGPAGLGLGP